MAVYLTLARRLFRQPTVVKSTQRSRVCIERLGTIRIINWKRMKNCNRLYPSIAKVSKTLPIAIYLIFGQSWVRSAALSQNCSKGGFEVFDDFRSESLRIRKVVRLQPFVFNLTPKMPRLAFSPAKNHLHHFHREIKS
jgi:hypothetical protein